MNTPVALEISKTQNQEILDHTRLNELQYKLEKLQEINDFINIDISENIVKSCCKNCGQEKEEQKSVCEICEKRKFHNKVSYSLMISGWVSTSLISSFLLDRASMFSFGAASGTILYNIYNFFT